MQMQRQQQMFMQQLISQNQAPPSQPHQSTPNGVDATAMAMAIARALGKEKPTPTLALPPFQSVEQVHGVSLIFDDFKEIAKPKEQIKTKSNIEISSTGISLIFDDFSCVNQQVTHHEEKILEVTAVKQEEINVNQKFDEKSEEVDVTECDQSDNSTQKKYIDANFSFDELRSSYGSKQSTTSSTG